MLLTKLLVREVATSTTHRNANLAPRSVAYTHRKLVAEQDTVTGNACMRIVRHAAHLGLEAITGDEDRHVLERSWPVGPGRTRALMH